MKILSAGLVGDVGGTNARFAIVDPEGRIRYPKTYACAEYASLDLIIAEYLKETVGKKTPPHAAIAVAGSDEAGLAPGVSSTMLVVYGVFGGIYLLYTVGWLIIAVRGNQETGIPLDDIMQHISTLLAIAAAPAWFIATLALTAGRRSWVRIVALLVGMLVLIPWGFVSGVSA